MANHHSDDEQSFLNAIMAIDSNDPADAEAVAAFAKAQAEFAAALEAKAAAAKAAGVKDGMHYAHDEQNSDGHTISAYRLVLGGKTILWALVDNDLTVSTQGLGKVPAGVSGHAITVASADRTRTAQTNGITLRAPHKDGTRVNGQMVAAFVLPRAGRWLGEFYGV